MSIKFISVFFKRNLSYTAKSFSLKMNSSKMMSTKSSGKSELPSISDLKLNLMQKMGVESGYNTVPVDRSYLLKYLPKSQEELPKRSMQDSFIAGLIPLSTNKNLQDKYVTYLGHVRVGRLLEDMDLFAVMVAQQHIFDPKLPEDVPLPHTLVTAFVDKIDFTNYVRTFKEDIKISGHVSWVGKSSMEVVVWLEQQMDGTWHRITRALFLMAARNSTNTAPAIVNAIEPANEREKQILSGGEERKENRLRAHKKHVSKVIPDADEQKIIYDLYLRISNAGNINLRKKSLPPGCVWMHNCVLSNIVFAHPQHRNRHNTVFGGFIMRQATELSWVLCFMFTKHRPKIKRINDINFQSPIAVNSLIQMHAHVVYTHMNFVQIITYVEINDPTTGNTNTANTLHFTFEIPEPVRECIPLTYHEAMMYIDGRRHFLDVTNEPASMKPTVNNKL